MLAAGDSIETILEGYPWLEQEDIPAGQRAGMRGPGGRISRSAVVRIARGGGHGGPPSKSPCTGASPHHAPRVIGRETGRQVVRFFPFPDFLSSRLETLLGVGVLAGRQVRLGRTLALPCAARLFYSAFRTPHSALESPSLPCPPSLPGVQIGNLAH